MNSNTRINGLDRRQSIGSEQMEGVGFVCLVSLPKTLEIFMSSFHLPPLRFYNCRDFEIFKLIQNMYKVNE